MHELQPATIIGPRWVGLSLKIQVMNLRMKGKEFFTCKVLLNGSRVNSFFWSSKHVIAIWWEGQSKEVVYGAFVFDYFVQIERHYAGTGALERTLEATGLWVLFVDVYPCWKQRPTSYVAMCWNRLADSNKTSARDHLGITLCFHPQQSNTNWADYVCSSTPSDARQLGETCSYHIYGAKEFTRDC